jgi:hypothetical protein
MPLVLFQDAVYFSQFVISLLEGFFSPFLIAFFWWHDYPSTSPPVFGWILPQPPLPYG